MKFEGVNYSEPDLGRAVFAECMTALKKEYYTTEIIESSVLDRLDFSQWKLFSDCIDLSVLHRISFKNSPRGSIIMCAPLRGLSPRTVTKYPPNMDSVNARYSQSVDPEFYAVLQLPHRYNALFIHPKNLWTSIEQLFTSSQDLPKAFKKKYILEADDSTQELVQVKNLFYQSVSEFDDLFVEIRNKLLIAGFRKNITVEQSLSLTRFLRRANDALSQEL